MRKNFWFYPKLSFFCKFSFTLSYFWGGGVFESSPTCLVGSAGSESSLILRVLFAPLVPCAYDFSLRASSGEH